jgi:hypothetical protein
MPVYIYPIIYSIIIAFGIFNYSKFKQNCYLKAFLFFLIYSFLTELTGTYVIRVLKIPSFFVYNTWVIASNIFYFLFFLSKIKELKLRKVSISMLVIFVLFTVINILFFKNYFNESLIYINILGKILTSVIIMIYYTEVLKSNDLLYFQKSLFFWISIGVLLYNIGFVPVFIIAELIDFTGIFRYIAFALNIILSLCFITGFIVSKKEYNV